MSLLRRSARRTYTRTPETKNISSRRTGRCVRAARRAYLQRQNDNGSEDGYTTVAVSRDDCGRCAFTRRTSVGGDVHTAVHDSVCSRESTETLTIIYYRKNNKNVRMYARHAARIYLSVVVISVHYLYIILRLGARRANVMLF